MTDLESAPLAGPASQGAVPGRARDVSWTGWALLAVSILLETAGQLFLKLGATQVNAAGHTNLEVVQEAATSEWALLGYLCMAIQFPVWLGVLARLDLSLAFPLGSLTQVTVLLATVFILGEPVQASRLLGIGAILVGTICIVGDDRP